MASNPGRWKALYLRPSANAPAGVLAKGDCAMHSTTIGYMALAGLVCAIAPTTAHGQVSSANGDETTQWRTSREAGLKAPGGWLSVAGLYWLKEGEKSIGTGTGNAVVLPPGSAPEKAGNAVLQDGKVTFNLVNADHATRNGQPVTTVAMRSDRDGNPDRIVLRDLTLTIIVRGQRTGIRLYDSNAASRTGFTGLKWYPVDDAYRVHAKFVPYPDKRTIPITNIIGDTDNTPNPGYVEFTLGGKVCRLDALAEGDGLFIIFRDGTTGKTTYHSGRFLDTEKPQDGFVTLDFNRAYNPPCAFTAYATCPLPPRQNYLPVAIPAGEKTYHHTE